MTENEESPSLDGQEKAGEAAEPIAVIVHLSGSRRGTTERLGGEYLEIGTSAESDVHLPADRHPEVGAHHAELRRRGETYQLVVSPERIVRVNGDQVEQLVLASGDLLQLGEDGPFLRFRVFADAEKAHKSMAQALADCVDCARYGGSNPFDRAGIFLASVPRELARQTRLGFRRGVMALLLALVLLTAFLTWRSVRLEKKLESAHTQVRGLAALLAEAEKEALRRDDLAAVQEEVRSSLTDTRGRLEALEADADAVRRVVSTAAGSVIFLQGSYGFLEPESGQPLRFHGIGPDGQPLRAPGGEPLVSTEGEGPLIESLFTGTAFVASDEGLLLTNRHVALPWEADQLAQRVVGQGFAPIIVRFLGYLAGVEEPFEVELVKASDAADLAVLRCAEVTGRVPPLPLSAGAAQPGDEIIVLGYPAGMRALLARADEAFVEELMRGPDVGFWTIARRLSAEGLVTPLATRGIVGQVSTASVVYDAETTSGGSGGPAVNLEGEVVAVNTAVMREFGGSNLGVPAAAARSVLSAAQEELEALLAAPEPDSVPAAEGAPEAAPGAAPEPAAEPDAEAEPEEAPDRESEPGILPPVRP